MLTDHPFTNWDQWRRDNLPQLVQLESIFIFHIQSVLNPEDLNPLVTKQARLAIDFNGRPLWLPSALLEVSHRQALNG